MNLRQRLLTLVLVLFTCVACLSDDEYNATVNVQGEVLTPGVFSYHEDMTVFDAVAMAGILPDRSDLRHVKLRRGGGGGMTVEIDIEKMRETGDSSANIRLAPGDTITVGRKWR
jgi:protein involved in polysaccharide export with SLBB domain